MMQHPGYLAALWQSPQTGPEQGSKAPAKKPAAETIPRIARLQNIDKSNIRENGELNVRRDL